MVGTTVAGTVVEPYLGYRTVGFVFLLSVIIVGTFGSFGVVLFAAGFSALAWNFGFIPPRFTFSISEPEDTILCVVYLFVAVITGFLTNRIRLHERLHRDREERMSVLYQTLQDISESRGKKEFIQKVTSRMGLLLSGDCGVILKSKEGRLDLSSDKSYQMKLEIEDQKVAQWTFAHRNAAGWSTETHSASSALFIPLQGVNENLGVFVFRPSRATRRLGPDQQNLLDSVVGQLGISIERHFLSRRLYNAERIKDSEKLHQTLLNSISHEMRTPLTVILGGAAALHGDQVKDPYVLKIADGLTEAGERLNRVIENLLDMSRLSSGVLALNLEWQDISDLIGVVLSKIARSVAGNSVSVEIAAGVGFIRADFRLFEHAISNLILNATQYAGASAAIRIHVYREDERIIISIEDNGDGIPETSRAFIFDKFYRVPGSAPGGTGLGLSIVKEIVELHKGHLYFLPVEPHGAKFLIELPVETQPYVPPEAPAGVI